MPQIIRKWIVIHHTKSMVMVLPKLYPTSEIIKWCLVDRLVSVPFATTAVVHVQSRVMRPRLLEFRRMRPATPFLFPGPRRKRYTVATLVHLDGGAALCITPRVWRHLTYFLGSASKVEPTSFFLHYIIIFRHSVAQVVRCLPASHHWDPEFTFRSLHVGFMVDKMESG